MTISEFFQTKEFFIACMTLIVTLLSSSLFQYFKNKVDWFQDTKKFKREYSFTQLKTLYLSLYAIICQSEYLRFFHNINEKRNDIPFIEAGKRREIIKHGFNINNIDFSNFTFNTTEFEINDAVTEFNKKKIYEMIIEKKEFASQNLLKLAVSYRYVHQYYDDETLESKEALNKFQDEELRIISGIIITIVKETNQKLKLCNMEFNEDELMNGYIKL